MKKISTILLSLLLLLALSACTNDKQREEQNPQNSSSVNDDAKQEAVSNDNTDNSNANNNNTSNNESETYISEERAIEIAISNAGVTRDSVYDLDAELDKEPNGVFWEVDFESGDFEYSYDIDATTGDIVNTRKEARD